MKKKHIILVLKFFVSGGLIWLLVDGVELGSAANKILTADPRMLGFACLVFIVQLFICVVRWRVVLSALGGLLSFLEGIHFYLIGMFFNQALPSSVGGDAVRIYHAYKRGLTLNCAINGVMLERVATVLGLILLVLITIPFFTDRVGSETVTWMLPSIILLGVAGIVGLVVLMFLDRLPSKFSHWKLVKGLAIVATDTRKVFLLPKNALKALSWSIVGHINVALGVYFLGLAIGLEITWLDCMVLFPPILLITTLPISIAGWGVREAVMVTAFALIGVPGEGALVLSIMFGLMGLLMGLPGGIFWLMSADKKIENISKIST